ncbi:MAG: response regulator [Deltaproteobacteria bacterium]|nr:response regulator [Deltaproteobacteria bacterium]
MDDRIRLLLVDDEEHFLQSLTARLRLRGFEVTALTNGAEALAAARREEHDLALVDLKMPGLDGEAVLEQLHRECPLMEVVIMTGHGSLRSAQQCERAGSFRYLQKPCETAVLLGVLEQAFRKRLGRALGLGEAQVAELAAGAADQSPLGVLRHLKRAEMGRKQHGGL